MKNYLYTVLIEKERNKLIQASKKHGMTSRETIRASQQLDQILNLFQHKLIEQAEEQFKERFSETGEVQTETIQSTVENVLEEDPFHFLEDYHPKFTNMSCK
ncbi:aspartyl-phosphate phosphatase Spo0E family protein [Aeribacillus alveayuensis]|uniref:Aspartyl-phosphate phosphatase Spo0E family protein n=1 Tax=Aeribacillus alveayuensis TaxID=279215 RepID=A0ABT9VSA4_9BACI|nr:hypothetical protein [Bacillus alveayuensis]